ncbi:MAG: hypothetical protein ACYDB7_04325, partial [Mycobacteriales bacterium]
SVTEVAGVPAAGGLPAARCFAVVPASPPPSPAVPGLAEVDPGTYCLSATGVPVLLRFPSGTLTLVRLQGPPLAAALLPPSSPLPLPARG